MSLDKNQQVGSGRPWLNGSSVTILIGALFAVRWLVKRAVGPVPESHPRTWLLVAQVIFAAGGLSWFFLTRKNPKLRASALVILALALATIGGLLTYFLEKPWGTDNARNRNFNLVVGLQSKGQRRQGFKSDDLRAICQVFPARLSSRKSLRGETKMEFRIWPKNKWLSMIRLLLIGMLLILITEYLVHGRRTRQGRLAQINAKVWHWRHGYSTYVGDYVVPVPDHWLVETREDRRTITLVDTRGRRTSDPLSGINVIDVVAHSNPIRDLDSWAAIQWHARDGINVRDVEEKTLRAGDERIVCLADHRFGDLMHVPGTSIVSVECQSNDRLSLRFFGHETDEFYTIASQIRKRK